MRVFVCVARRGSDGGAGECMRGPSGYLALKNALSLIIQEKSKECKLYFPGIRIFRK